MVHPLVCAALLLLLSAPTAGAASPHPLRHSNRAGVRTCRADLRQFGCARRVVARRAAHHARFATPGRSPHAATPLDDVTALARVLRSETGSHTLPERVAIGWVARNRAAQRAVSLATLACTPTCGPAREGHGFSSRLVPRPADLALARRLLALPPAADPTRGATYAFEPALQDRLYAARRPGYFLDANGVRRKWRRTLAARGRVGRWELFGPHRHP